jgi:phosphoribosyl 1,2-cyclic phosphate phosphodiesterase
MLRTVSVLVLDALRMQPHETHFSFEQALETAAGLNAPKLTRVFLTHISHEHSHAEITAYCERWLAEHGIRNMTVVPAYDGLEIEI